jgi:hypothetical protein
MRAENNPANWQIWAFDIIFDSCSKKHLIPFLAERLLENAALVFCLLKFSVIAA